MQFLHHCTGLSSFHDLFDLKFNAGVLRSDDDVIERLNATIDEVRRATDTVVGARARVLDQYHAKRNREAPLLSCAACGIREFDVDDNGYQRFALSRLKTFTYQFPRDADLVARIERAAAHRDPVSGVSYDKIFSSYSCGTTRYHLHPEFVDDASPSLVADEPSALLCQTCAKGADGGNLPARCIATCDFGDLRRVGIDGLYPLEWLAIATARTYMCVYKLSGANAGTGVAATLRGQCITFQQVAAPGAVANMLPARDVHERISVMFVGPRAQLETQLGKALPFGANFSPRLDVMKRVLLALKHVENPYYKDVIIDADSAAAKRYFEGDKSTDGSFMHSVIAGTTVEDDEDVINVDVVAADTDPSAAQPQAAANRGEGAAHIAPDAELVIEDVFAGPLDFHVLGHLVHCMVQCCVAVRVSPVDAHLRTTIQEPTNASGVSFCRGVH